MSCEKRWRMIEAGTCPRRKPGMRASFRYFWMSTSVSRETSSGGISTSISRLVLGAVSVGLTFYLSKRVARPAPCVARLNCLALDGRRTTHDRFSLRRRVIAVPAVNFQSFMFCNDLDGAVPAIMLEIFRVVCQSILIAKVSLNLRKGVSHVGHLERFKPAAAGGVGDTLQNLVVFAAF